MTDRQEKGEALESLTYEVLKEQLLSRLGSSHQVTTKNGFMCSTENYELFWNKQVVKQGDYPKMVRINGKLVKFTGKRKRLPDIVLCDRTLLPESRRHDFPDASAILAIELKNTNLNFQWTTADLFDRDVMERFLWTASVARTLSMDNGGWEKYAEIENLFPKAIKVLITPKFAYYPKAFEVPSENGVDGGFKVMRKLRRAQDLLPSSESEKDQIDWRIRRLKLRIEELGYQPLPRVPVPDEVRDKMYKILIPYLDEVKVGYPASTASPR